VAVPKHQLNKKLKVPVTCTDVFSWQIKVQSALQQSEYRSFSQVLYTFCLSAHTTKKHYLKYNNKHKYQCYTHTQPFNGPFSGITWVSQYQKGKTNLDFTKARDSVWQWHQLGHMQVCISLQTDNHASTLNPI